MFLFPLVVNIAVAEHTCVGVGVFYRTITAPMIAAGAGGVRDAVIAYVSTITPSEPTASGVDSKSSAQR